MSNTTNQIYLEEKAIEFQEILKNEDWEQIDNLYIEMEEDGMGEYVPQISQLMTDEDVINYKRWDKRVNGDIDAQTDDNS